ncbi:MAG: CehA/McbA family metallohydrolase, partial [Planctomycetota bacterium]
IEAHGTGGNKNVPVNVIHNLTDSLDQMEPESYYHLLDCGFRLPLTNGSDHPARTLGIARSFVKMARPFTYDRWIEAIRRGKTFTTSGPMIFLTVNGDHVGSVQECNEDKSIDIVARFVSRDPIGTMQIISNGNVIAEKETDLVDATMRLSMTAKESRWIVARCSRRSDGRADFGFGNFNAITGPGIAHTSPIYINVAGRPRFEPLAASYWQGRIRQHIGEVDTTGRFATRSQRQEAVKYLQEGLEMFAQLESDIDSARSRSESWMVARSRFANVIRRFGGDKRSKDVLEKLSQATNEGEFKYALQPLIALRVSVNPESRVKVDAITPELSLREGRPQRFLVEVENTAGITAPLNLTAIDITQSPPGPASWCSIDIVDSPFTSRFFSGALKEYKVIEIIPHTSGLKEVRVVGDAGQGTQDLGFRATTDLMLKIEPKGSTQ